MSNNRSNEYVDIHDMPRRGGAGCTPKAIAMKSVKTMGGDL